MATLHALVEGPDDAPVLLLGPSLGTDVGLWDAQVATFAGSHRVIRYDLRGHGGSEVVPGPCTMADLAGDVVALLDRLGVNRFSYAGVSIGGGPPPPRPRPPPPPSVQPPNLRLPAPLPPPPSCGPRRP